MTAWMVMALLGLTLTLPIFDGDDAEDDTPDSPDTPETPETPDAPEGATRNGTGGDDLLSANANDTVNGLDGDDTISSTAEGTTLNGGAGADAITLTAATGTVNGGEGTDTINVEGTTDADTPATFTVNGDAGDDTITASGIGGTVLGGGAEDVITVEGRLDSVDGGAGNDTITATSASYGGGTDISGSFGNDVISVTEGAGVNTQSEVSGGEGTDRLSTEMVVNDGAVDVFDIFTGGSGADVFEMSFLNPQADAEPSAGGTLGTVLQITDFNAEEDQLIVDLSTFPVFATQVDAPNNITFDVVERPDGSGSDVTFTVANADADAPLTGTIALEGALGLVADDVSLVFSGTDNAP